MKIDLQPKVCPICGGRVEYVESRKIYGNNFKYGIRTNFCYHCTKCDAIVGTHRDSPKDALGLLADKETRVLRQRNHSMFDRFWKKKAEREKLYERLSKEMDIPLDECHFAWFNKEELERSYQIMLRWWREVYDR